MKSVKILIVGLLVSYLGLAQAAPEPKDPKHRTPQGLYVTPMEAYDMMKKDPKVILIDVRTPEEQQFVGYTPMAQIMIPTVLFDYTGTKKDDFNKKKGRYFSYGNSNWISEFEDKAADLGVDDSNTYIVMCRSGTTRAQPAAKMMYQYGYKNVYLMVGGFEGGKVKEGITKGYRFKEGWKFAGLPWTYKINPEHTYFVQK